MAAATTSYDRATASKTVAQPLLRPTVAGAAAFDAAMGIWCLVDASRFAGWLSISDSAARSIGVVFLVAAVVGVETLLLPRLGTRWVIGANVLFALWCLGVIAFDGPGTVGIALLAVAAVSSAGTAWLERRLSR
jgi:hypothetical protein